jgi:hypothetical protein
VDLDDSCRSFCYMITFLFLYHPLRTSQPLSLTHYLAFSTRPLNTNFLEPRPLIRCPRDLTCPLHSKFVEEPLLITSSMGSIGTARPWPSTAGLLPGGSGSRPLSPDCAVDPSSAAPLRLALKATASRRRLSTPKGKINVFGCGGGVLGGSGGLGWSLEGLGARRRARRRARRGLARAAAL